MLPILTEGSQNQSEQDRRSAQTAVLFSSDRDFDSTREERTLEDQLGEPYQHGGGFSSGSLRLRREGAAVTGT